MKNILKALLPGAILLFTMTSLIAQDCRPLFPDKVGSVREMKSYDTKNKLTAVSRQEVIDKIVSGQDVQIRVRSTSYTPDDKEVSTVELDLVCEDGIFKFDMKNFMDPNTMEAYKDMSVEMSGDQLAYPSGLSAGQKLADGTFKMVVKNNNITLLTMTTNITNRQVEGIESVTTEAGTFSCYKIRYNMMIKAGFITTNLSAIEWIADGVGVVRSESFDKKGKPAGYTVLSSLK